MSNNDRLQRLIDWAKLKPSRTITIEIGQQAYNGSASIWAYDYELTEGQYIDISHVDDIDKLDLEKQAEDAKRAEYEKLKAEFEEGK
jgi:hypothetical protein